MAAGHVKGETENALVKFVEIQAAIEAIDRAIEDEEIEDENSRRQVRPSPGERGIAPPSLYRRRLA